jgi:hypothetical protein
MEVGLTLRTGTAAITSVLLLAAGCSGDGSAAFCDRVAVIRRLESLGQESIDVVALRDLRRELAGINAEAALQNDVDTMIGVVDFIIDRYGGIDLEHPTAEEVAKLQVAQHELDSRILDAEIALTRLRDAAAAC